MSKRISLITFFPFGLYSFSTHGSQITKHVSTVRYEHSKVRADSGRGNPTSEVLEFVRLLSDSCPDLRSLWIAALSPDGRDGQVRGLWIGQVLLPLP